MYENLTHNDLVKIIEEYKHRFAMIKDDVKAIYKCTEMSSKLTENMVKGYGDFSPEVCLLNIETACDLSSDECLEWRFYTNL
jgi:hypothetical protein